ncbi:MgtC/SapB family protein [Fusibacter sp. 3D3]|uniref:MgtC/SapB family protein n=1 Tax=Fusibacter sp. 3D3 TaxID=1048380 RepID=UPI00085320FC|nr:MgtC/SapB family protein [Fusibacter sp. 3D3]GAU77362.1 Mg(2+) transport ATPase protein C [Fusibacter sp. 3D3]
MTLNFESIIKILFATFIGGLIGFEREVINRPAGFRTHILVCVASAIIMDVNLLLAATHINMDPTRLGAQVISGIGFLGAGTIIKEGATVKGLTTAASLWSIACIGLVVGAGYYLIALITAVIMLITLKTFSQIEKKLTRAKRLFTLLISTDDAPERLGTITLILGEYNCRINKVTLSHEAINNHTVIEIDYIPPYGIKNIDIIHKLESLVGILKVELKRSEQET